MPWNTWNKNNFPSKQVFERDDNGHSISCTIFRQQNITNSSPRRADTWFPSLPPKGVRAGRPLESQLKFLGWITGVFFAWACATSWQAICMKAYRRVFLYQNGASQSSIIEILLLVGLGECARDLTKCVPWVPEYIFSLSILLIRGEARQRGAKCRGEKAFNINRFISS